MWRVAVICLCISTARGGEYPPDGPINRAIAATPDGVTITIPQTQSLMDLGSIGNDLKFSDGRSYRFVFDQPFEFSGDGVRYQDAHFTIYRMNGYHALPDAEVIAHGSAAEKRIISLLDSLVSTTTDEHQKKNATTLLVFLKDRKRGFAMGKKWWDFTPWHVDRNRVRGVSPTASPLSNEHK
jgi:hypothetical protein